MDPVTFPLDERGSFAWIADRADPLSRCSTALVLDQGVLLIDPVDTPGLDQRIEQAGTPIGVCRLIDRHRRDTTAITQRLGVAELAPAVLAGTAPPLPSGEIEERVVLAAPGWNESVLWLPERRLLIIAEAVGSSRFFLAHDDDRLGVHPLLRLRPPRGALAVAADVVACGHGEPVSDAADALRAAVASARQSLPHLVRRAARSVVTRN
jgi:hypothetical protein